MLMRTAKARVKAKSVSPEYWLDIRSKARGGSLLKSASAKVVLDSYDPEKYLLTHCTIVASVDTEETGLPTGKFMSNGVQIERLYSDFYVTPSTRKYINNNFDSFERRLLLSTYRTFIGAQNYCFVPGTMIVMADGTQKPIELVEEGDSVLTHLGRPRKVLRTFERQVDEDICDVYVDRFKSPISCTKEHPFRTLNVNCPDPSRYLRDGDGWLQGEVSTEETWVEAGSLKPYNFLLGPAESLQKEGSVFSWYRGHHVHSVRSVESRRYTGLVYNFEVEGDNSYVLGLTGVAVHNCEHVQIPELSKGRVIDAAARDIGESIYIDILVATERKHVELVRDIASGAMSTLSMGAQISFSICTFCGNVAQDEVQLCPHVKYAKGTKFVDASGQERVIAELCGHWTVPESVKFIEASWVGVPAFTGAVVRGVLEPGAAVAEAIKGKLVDSFQSSRVEDLSKARTLAASLKTAQFGQGQEQGSTQQEEPAPPSDTLEGPSNDLYKALVDSVKTKVEEELAKRDQKKTEDIMDPNASNESLVKSALMHPKWQRRAKALLQKSSLDKVKKVLAGLYLYEVAGMDAVAKRRIYTGAELLGLVRMRDFFERKASYAGEQRITSTVIAVGSLRKFSDQDSYFTACASHMGRNPNNIERMHLLEKARIFSLGID